MPAKELPSILELPKIMKAHAAKRTKIAKIIAKLESFSEQHVNDIGIIAMPKEDIISAVRQALNDDEDYLNDIYNYLQISED